MDYSMLIMTVKLDTQKNSASWFSKLVKQRSLDKIEFIKQLSLILMEHYSLTMINMF